MKVHFIAIGGSVMHNLALALRKKGYKVTGSDDEIYGTAADRLKAGGLFPEAMGWQPDRITDELDAVIVGMHARPDNPELKKAQKLGLKIHSFPDYVYQQSKRKTRVVIGGSHGKTTITAMVMHTLKYWEYNFDYLVGSQLDGFDLMVKLSDDAPIIILEGDEYLASPLERVPKFHLYRPHIGLISGIAWDHFNVFPSFEVYKAQFAMFVETFEDNGLFIYNQEDPLVRELALYSNPAVEKIPYYTPDYRIENGHTQVRHSGKYYPLQIFGRHNLQNIEAARNICQALNMSDARFFEAIQSFTGAAKRMETIGENDDTILIRDFAHAPSKVKAATAALKEQYPNRHLVTCLELHTFSSLNKEFIQQYKGALEAADTAIVYCNPHVFEAKRLPMLTAKDIEQAFGRSDLYYCSSPDEITALLKQQQWQHTNLLMMSSGNFDGIDWEQVKQITLG